MKPIVVDHESKVPETKRIGVIGGYGQRATVDVVNRILAYSAGHIPQYGNRGYPQLNVFMANKAPMRLNSDGSYPDELKASQSLIQIAKQAGDTSDIVIIASNTPHMFLDEIQVAAGKPIISMVDVVQKDLRKRACKRVGVLGINLTVSKGLYQASLKKLDLDIILLSDELARQLDDEGVYPVQEGSKIDDIGNPNIAHSAVDYLRQRGADCIILGCTEIPILLGPSSDDSDIINPSQLLVEAAVDWALEAA